ncbi:MAG: polysaccharide biosynthesis/export family protein [Crocinitomicaceae bacterium]|jgi:polysaccharide export outer membrane protein|nr:polysaccharide biosynthesis/export family protein [Crocinitomicaceae bacterium]
MFKSKDEKYATVDATPMKPSSDYQISVDDKITFSLSTNNGTTIIESLSGINKELQTTNQQLDYVVRQDGTVELPILGNVYLKGFTVIQAEDTLQKLFAKEYNNPFVQLKITNQRVIIFPGGGSDARVIPLLNSNTTLMEVIAQAGGIAERGKANTVKIIRRENGERKMYKIDLSTVEGLKFVDMVVQANDYVYIEPKAAITRGVVTEIAPVVSILSSALIIFTVIKNSFN